MALYFYDQFLRDLRNEVDAKFPRRVLSKVLDAQGKFVVNADDHRYEGITNAWIRYVSIGGAGIRVIFIRNGSDIYLYRAGPHSVEDGLTAPSSSDTATPILPAPAELTDSADAHREANDDGRFFENYRRVYIRTKMLGRRMAKHKSVVLVSPYVSTELFQLSSPFWRVLHDLQNEGAKVSLITRAPKKLDELKFYERLEANGLDVLFHDTVHAKLYLFEADPNLADRELRGLNRTMALVGSANLTVAGLAIGTDRSAVEEPNEEIMYEVPQEQYKRALDYATYLSVAATDIPKQRVLITKRERRSGVGPKGDFSV